MPAREREAPPGPGNANAAESEDHPAPDASLSTVAGQSRLLRQRLTLKSELALAAIPTATVLAMLLLLEILSNHRLLFASLAASAFLIYLDPMHGMNSVRTLSLAHAGAATLGITSWYLLGHGYLAGALAMVATIVYMIVLDAMHPPAISTSLIFAVNKGTQNQFPLFLLALAIIVALVVLQRLAVWLFARLTQD